VKKKSITQVSRRERQILDILYQLGDGSVSDVRKALPDPPSYSSVRALLGVLEDKGYVRHKKQGRVYIYTPRVGRAEASRTMLNHVVKTFFDGSVEQVVATLMNMSNASLTEEEFDRLARLIDKKRKPEKK
jgi:predicted transcriptional regulator